MFPSMFLLENQLCIQGSKALAKYYMAISSLYNGIIFFLIS